MLILALINRMSLYGDLPPPSSSDSNAVDGSFFSTERFGAPIIQPVASKSSQPPAMKPSTLAFKPRQTKALPSAAATATNLTSSTPVSKPNLNQGQFKPPDSKFSFVAVDTVPVSSNKSINNNAENDIIKEQKVKGKENSQDNRINDDEEFINKNTTFEVSEEDAYDPRRPNDYIAYCEERLQQRKSAKLAEDNKRLMEEKDRAREELEKERREAALRGDYQSIAAKATFTEALSSSTTFSTPQPVGRGRGRGSLSNLPAWMTALPPTSSGTSVTTLDATKSSSDRYEDAPPVQPNPNPNPSKRKMGMFSKPSCVVLLKNMVSADDAEELEMLAEETKGECLKFGPVESCLVQQLPTFISLEVGKGTEIAVPDSERVRTFVKFERQDSAIRAYRDMNGRFFAGRQIAASFFEETKFDRMELAPSLGEW